MPCIETGCFRLFSILSLYTLVIQLLLCSDLTKSFSLRKVCTGRPTWPSPFFYLFTQWFHIILESELCIWYFDDDSIVGTADVVERNLDRVKCEVEDLGLHLNEHKSELVCSDGELISTFYELLPGVLVTLPTSVYLVLPLTIWSLSPWPSSTGWIILSFYEVDFSTIISLLLGCFAASSSCLCYTQASLSSQISSLLSFF